MKKYKKTLPIALATIFISFLLLTYGCKKQYILPSLKSLVNARNETLRFSDTNGNIQTISIGVDKRVHGTGPMSPKQESLTITYYYINGYGFKLKIDGDGGGNDQWISFQAPVEQ